MKKYPLKETEDPQEYFEEYADDADDSSGPTPDTGPNTGLAVGLSLAAVALVLACAAMAALAVVKRRRKASKDVKLDATCAATIPKARAQPLLSS